MAHGAIDYSNVWGDEGIYVITDLGELAAMLGCPSVFHRSGNIVYLDSFKYGHSAWQPVTAGAGGSIQTVATYPFMGPFSCLLQAGSDGLLNANISRYLGVMPSLQMGVEVAVMFRTAFDHFDLWLIYDDQNYTQQALIKMSDTNDNLSVWVDNDHYVEFGDLPPSVLYYGLYHRIKLIADFENHAYSRFLYDDQSFDLSDYSIGLDSNSGIPGLNIILSLYSRAGNNDKAQAGMVICTQREPIP